MLSIARFGLKWFDFFATNTRMFTDIRVDSCIRGRVKPQPKLFSFCITRNKTKPVSTPFKKNRIAKTAEIRAVGMCWMDDLCGSSHS